MSEISKSDLTKETKGHLNKYIALADQKASLLLTGQLTFLGLSATALHEIFTRDGCLFETLATLTIAAGVAGVFLSISVVYPRTPKAEKGFIFWGNITQYNSPEDFKDDYYDLTGSERLDNLVIQNYYLAAVANRKYYWLRWALRATILMVLFGVAAVGVHVFL